MSGLHHLAIFTCDVKWSEIEGQEMIRIAFVFCLLMAALPAGAACTGANLIDGLAPPEKTALDVQVASHPYPEGNLWRAEKPGSIVHVVGTIHVPDPRLPPIARRAIPLVEASDVLILEASSAMQVDMQRRMAEQPELAFLTEGPTLIDLLGDEIWGDLADDLTARGIPPFVAAKFRPWFLAITLATPGCAMDALASGETGLDGILEAAANTSGIPVETLDELDNLIGLLGAGPLEEQIDMLRVMLMTEQDQEAMFATTLDSYFAGRHRELWEFGRLTARESGLDDPDAAFGSFEDTLLIARNEDWEGKIAPLIEGRDAVLAVGAAHLSGESGILRALERLGYSLARL